MAVVASSSPSSSTTAEGGDGADGGGIPMPSPSSSATAAVAAAAVGECADDGIVSGDGVYGSVESSPAEDGTAGSGAGEAVDVDVDDGWGSIVVPAVGAGGGRRAVTLAEALRIGEDTRAPIDPSEEEQRRRGMLRESISIETSSAPAEEVVAEEEEAEKAREEVAKKEEEEVEEEEVKDTTFTIESDVADSATAPPGMTMQVEEEEVEDTTPTIESDVADSATAPQGTTMQVEEEEQTTSTIESDVAGSATHESPEAGEEGWTTIPSQESEVTLTRTDPQRRPRLSSDGKEIFEPSRSSSTEVNQENVDVGLFVLTQSLFALKSILNKD